MHQALRAEHRAKSCWLVTLLKTLETTHFFSEDNEQLWTVCASRLLRLEGFKISHPHVSLFLIVLCYVLGSAAPAKHLNARGSMLKMLIMAKLWAVNIYRGENLVPLWFSFLIKVLSKMNRLFTQKMPQPSRNLNATPIWAVSHGIKAKWLIDWSWSGVWVLIREAVDAVIEG